jgi:HEAT repeat protein
MKNKSFSSIKADEIIRLLEEPTKDRRPLKYKLQREASVKELVNALWSSKKVLTSRILCDILGARRARTAIPALVNCLNQPDQDLKNDAAEALGKIGSPKAGNELLRHFIDEPCLWYAVALGAIGYNPAIPYLIAALHSASSSVRGGAAWSLGELIAYEAENVLISALAKEDYGYAKNRISEALNIIQEAKKFHI